MLNKIATILGLILAISLLLSPNLYAQALGPQSFAGSTVGLHADGTVYTCGYNGYGQLGDGTTTDRNTPIKVLKGVYNGTTYLGDNPGNKIIAVALGGNHSLALAADGTVYAWGGEKSA